MMTIDGEKVWVPGCRRELIAGLKRMGIHKVAGEALERLPKESLRTAYCRERARIVRRQHQEQRSTQRTLHQEIPAMPGVVQLELFGGG